MRLADMAGPKENLDWSLVFIEPSVVNTVTYMLQRFDSCRGVQAPSEFVRSYFETTNSADLLKKKLTRLPRRKSDKIRSTLVHRLNEYFKQKQEHHSEDECENPSLCKMTYEHLHRKSERQENNLEMRKESINTESLDYPENRFRCVCSSDEESSSGIDSDIDSESSVQQVPCSIDETDADKKKSSRIPDETDTCICAECYVGESTAEIKTVPESTDRDENRTETKSSQILKPGEDMSRSLNIRIPSITEEASNDVKEMESDKGNDSENIIKLESNVSSKRQNTSKNQSLSINENLINTNNGNKRHSIGINSLEMFVKNDERTLTKITEIENEEDIPDETKREREHKENERDVQDKNARESAYKDGYLYGTEDLTCQRKDFPTKCALFSVPKNEFIQLTPTKQTKPDKFCISLDDDYKQAAIKMFLYILDLEEFINISLTAFTKSTRPQISIYFPMFKVIFYLIIFNLSHFTFNGTVKILLDPYPTKCSQLLSFIKGDDYQKYYEELLHFYDQDFVRHYAYDHVKGMLIAKMHEEIRNILEKPIITEVHRVEIPLRLSKPNKTSLEPPESPTKKTQAPESESPVNIIAAKPVPKTTYAPPSNKFYKSFQEYEKEREEKMEKNKMKAQLREAQSKQRESQDTGSANESLRNEIPAICDKDLGVATCEGCQTAKKSAGIMCPYSTTISKITEYGKAPPKQEQFPREKRHTQKATGVWRATTVKRSLVKSRVPPKTTTEDTKQAERYRMPRTEYVPPMMPVPVKPTAASVLREAAQLRNNELKTLQKLEWIASGGADWAAVEEQWARLREERQREELEALERKHLQGLLTREEAILARRHLVARQRDNALVVKRQREELEKQLEIFRKEEEEKIKLLVEKTHVIEMAAKVKPKEVQKLKSDTVQQMVRESRIQMAELQKQRREELMQRISLIRELRALQGLTKMRHKEIDLTESAGLGLMGEMSIAELNERLNLLREELREELERKRAKTQSIRAQMKQRVQESQDYINQQRMNRATDQNPQPSLTKNTKTVESEELKQLREKLNETRRLRLAGTF